jgi:hypothetical protein
MKRLLILLLCLQIVFCETIAQTADISCNSAYPRYSFGYLNYRAFPLGTVFVITFKRNLFGRVQDIITDIHAVGRVNIEKANVDTVVLTSDSIIEALTESSAYNIGLSLNTNDDTVKKKINMAVSKDLNFVLVHPRDSLILNINSVKRDLWALDLPPLKKNNTMYAICDRVIYSDDFLLGFVRDGNFSSTLSIDVPKDVSETGQVTINNSCNQLVNIVGKTYGFFTFVGITDNGEMLTEEWGGPYDIFPAGTRGGDSYGNYILEENRIMPARIRESSSYKRTYLVDTYKNARSNKDTPKFKLPRNSDKPKFKILGNSEKPKRSKK